jgi:hypothetical protein
MFFGTCINVGCRNLIARSCGRAAGHFLSAPPYFVLAQRFFVVMLLPSLQPPPYQAAIARSYVEEEGRKEERKSSYRRPEPHRDVAVAAVGDACRKEHLLLCDVKFNEPSLYVV